MSILEKADDTLCTEARARHDALPAVMQLLLRRAHHERRKGVPAGHLLIVTATDSGADCECSCGPIDAVVDALRANGNTGTAAQLQHGRGDGVLAILINGDQTTVAVLPWLA